MNIDVFICFRVNALIGLNPQFGLYAKISGLETDSGVCSSSGDRSRTLRSISRSSSKTIFEHALRGFKEVKRGYKELLIKSSS